MDKTKADFTEVEQKSIPKRILQYQAMLENTEERERCDRLTNLVIKYCRPDLQSERQARHKTSESSAVRGQSMQTSIPFSRLNLASDGLQSQIVSEAIDWFRYRSRDDELNDDDGFQEWIQRCERHMYNVFSDTNFYPLCHPMFMNALSIGNSPQFIEEDVSERRPVCQAFQVTNVWFSVDRYGRITAAHREFWLGAEEAWQEFRDKEQWLSKALKEAVVKDPLKKFRFIHAYYKKGHTVMRGKPYDRAFQSFYIQADNNPNNEDDGAVLREEGYNGSRWINWRFMHDGLAPYGRGVLGNAIVTVQQLHYAHRDLKEASQLSVKPPVLADRNLKGRLRLLPNGVTWRDNSQYTVEEAYNRRDYPFGVEIVERHENEIDELLNIALLLLLTRSEKQMTAREAVGKLQEKAALLGPRLRWLQKDFLSPTHDIFWDIEARAGRLPEPPRSVLRYIEKHGELRLDTVYMGPLAQMQQAMHGTRRLESTLVTAEPIMRIAPEVVPKVDWVEVFERELDRGGWPQDTIRSDQEYRRIMAERQDLERQAQQAQLNRDQAEAFKKMTEGYVQRDKVAR